MSQKYVCLKFYAELETSKVSEDNTLLVFTPVKQAMKRSDDNKWSTTHESYEKIVSYNFCNTLEWKMIKAFYSSKTKKRSEK